VKLKISEAGRYDGVLKLRQGGDREFFDVGRIVVEEKDELDDVISVGEDEEIVLNKEPEVDVLNGVVYESRDSKVVDWLPYGFCVFLIFVIGILVWERR